MQIKVEWQLRKPRSLSRNAILTFMTQSELIRANLIAAPVQTILPYLHFNPLPQAMCIRLLKVYLQIKLPVKTKLTPKFWKTAHQLLLPLWRVLSTIPLLWVLLHLHGRKQKSFQFLNPGTVRSLWTRGQYRHSLFYLEYAKEQFTCSLPISSIQTMSYVTCTVEIENFTLPIYCLCGSKEDICYCSFEHVQSFRQHSTRFNVM